MGLSGKLVRFKVAGESSQKRRERCSLVICQKERERESIIITAGAGKPRGRQLVARLRLGRGWRTRKELPVKRKRC